MDRTRLGYSECNNVAPCRAVLVLGKLKPVLLVFVLLGCRVADSASLPAADRLPRILIDPCLGLHWQLIADPTHPGGPRKLVLIGAGGLNSPAPGSTLADQKSGFNIERNFAGAGYPSASVIRAGDRVTVDQDSAYLHARLQAVALESAEVGQTLRVRLNLGNSFGTGQAGESGAPAPVIPVVAVEAGLTKWLPPEQTEP